MAKRRPGSSEVRPVPSGWDPRRAHPVKFSRAEIERLFDQNGELSADHLMLLMTARIDEVERSSLSMMEKIDATLPLEETLLRLAVMQEVLGLLHEAAERLRRLDQQEAEDQFDYNTSCRNRNRGGPSLAN